MKQQSRCEYNFRNVSVRMCNFIIIMGRKGLSDNCRLFFRNKKIHLSKRGEKRTTGFLYLHSPIKQRIFLDTRNFRTIRRWQLNWNFIFVFFFISLLRVSFLLLFPARWKTRLINYLSLYCFEKNPVTIFFARLREISKNLKAHVSHCSFFLFFFFVIFQNENFTRIKFRATILCNGVSEMIFFRVEHGSCNFIKKKSKLEVSSISKIARYDEINFPFYSAILILVNCSQISRDI